MFRQSKRLDGHSTANWHCDVNTGNDCCGWSLTRQHHQQNGVRSLKTSVRFHFAIHKTHARNSVSAFVQIVTTGVESFDCSQGTLSRINVVFKYADDTNLLVPENTDIPFSDEFSHIELWTELTD